jgi:predicted DNA-binding transcriptional regulator AlpA
MRQNPDDLCVKRGGAHADNGEVSAPQDLTLLLQRFQQLPPREQFTAYREIRDQLAGRITETKRDRIVRRKAEAIDAIAAVAAHLDLPVGTAPTPSQFDSVAKELGLGWNRSLVRRSWGRWRDAKAAFLNEPSVKAVAKRTMRMSGLGRARNYEPPLRCVELWLASKPKGTSPQAYIDWADAYNDGLPKEAVHVLKTAAAVGRSLRTTWPDVVALARGEITEAQARPPKERRREQFARGGHDLISASEVQEILETSVSGFQAEAGRADFPAPVILVEAGRLWLREDIIAYKGGRRFSPEENAKKYNVLRPLYLTIGEVIALGVSRYYAESGAKGAPRPALIRGRTRLWLRAEVEEWLDTRRAASAHRSQD